MKTKAHILVVEDQALIYKRMKTLLKENYYSVDNYTPSVKEAIGVINKKRPDLVLLDIDLQGEHNGIYLGNLLKKEYQIPFIYVTDFDDEQTFYEGLKTKQNDYITKQELHLSEESPMIIQTKPHLNEKRLLRSIQTALELHKTKPSKAIKDDVLVYTDYIKNTKKFGKETLSEIGIPFKEIAFFTTNSDEIDTEKTSQRKKTVYKKLEVNNARAYTWLHKSFIVPNNLSVIMSKVPSYFVRISEDYIVNIDNQYALQGRINGKRIKIADQVLEISDRYKTEVDKRFGGLYERMR